MMKSSSRNPDKPASKAGRPSTYSIVHSKVGKSVAVQTITKREPLPTITKRK